MTRTRELAHNAVRVTADDPASGQMQISLIKNNNEIASVKIPTSEAAQIAALILGTAQRAFDQSGKPNPHQSKEEKVDLTVIYPSGTNVGPGRKPSTLIAMFYFGDSVLGIELPNDYAQTLAQRLMTSAAQGTPQ